jgi:hypothetical protein
VQNKGSVVTVSELKGSYTLTMDRLTCVPCLRVVEADPGVYVIYLGKKRGCFLTSADMKHLHNGIGELLAARR